MYPHNAFLSSRSAPTTENATVKGIWTQTLLAEQVIIKEEELMKEKKTKPRKRFFQFTL